MRKKIVYIGLFGLLTVACKNDLPKEKTDDVSTQKQVVDTIDMKIPLVKEKHLENGIHLEWLKEGEGELLKDGHVYNIDYRVRLEDSTIIDGVHLLRKPYIPYLLGYNMQPKGWDITLREMKVGDFVKAKIPSRLLRGEHEAKGLIPKHADNFLNVRVISEVEPSRNIDGVKVWIMSETNKKTPQFGTQNKIEFYTMASTKTNPMYFNSFASGKPFTAKLEDSGLIPGLKKALINSKKGDRLLILVPSSQAYGTKGLLDLVKPNEDVFFNLYVNDVIE